jgi:hypothetical protein
MKKENKMKNKNVWLWLLVLLVVSLTVTSCGSDSSDQSNFPTGKFTWAGSEYVGIYLNEDNTWSGFYYGEEVDKGTYEVKGNLYTQTSEAPNLPAECAAPATYEWTFDGTNLSFKLYGEDKCDIRRESFDGQAFILTKE